MIGLKYNFILKTHFKIFNLIFLKFERFLSFVSKKERIHELKRASNKS